VARGWLDATAPLPTDAEIAAALGTALASPATISTLVLYRSVVERSR
jgi:uncharacterized membrane protein